MPSATAPSIDPLATPADLAGLSGLGPDGAVASGFLGGAASPRFATYLSYGVGMTGNQILRDVPTAMLLFYMTNTLFIPAAFAGFAILLPKIWVMFADPLVGSLSDRTRTRWGPRKPFLFAGSIISTITFIALFTSPMPASPLLATILIGILYTLLATGYSIYSVPYLTMAAELGDEPSERTTALAYKQTFCLVGVMAGLALAPWLVADFGGSKAGYAVMAQALGLILFITTMLTALLVPTRKPSSSVVKLPGNLITQIAGAFEHKPFKIVFIASTLQLFAFGIAQGGGLYFLTYVMQMPISVLGITVAASVIGSGASQPIWVKLSTRYGTIPTYIAASIFAAMTAAGVLLLPPGAIIPYAVLATISGAATGGFTLMSFAALVEAIALDGPDSNRKGLFAAAYSAMEKAMLAVGGFVMAITLSLAHFVQGAPRSAQPASMLHALVIVYVAVPVLLKIASVMVLRRYPKAARA
jgi:GPH family glycoside/pentoside/hexuronide:cation symporter